MKDIDKPVVIITWIDAQDHAQKWVDAIDAEAFTDEDCTITSIGFLVKRTDKYITLAGDYDMTDNDYGRVTKIPIKMCTSITEARCEDILERAGETKTTGSLPTKSD